MDVNMRIAVLFDGAGLARLGLEQAGHTCTGYEIDEAKHYLSQMVGSGNSVLADVRDVDLSGFDAIWASPPCQEWSDNNQGTAAKTGALLDWTLALVEKYPDKVIWIENVLSRKRSNAWGTLFNAAQFLAQPIQNRPRVIKVHNAPLPSVYRLYQRQYADLDICPTVVASERSGGGFSFNPKTERRKASMWYGRPMSLREMAYHQGLDIPDGLIRSWFHLPPLTRTTPTGRIKPYTRAQWTEVLSEAIGNGVPVYMARAFGEAAQRIDVTNEFLGLPMFDFIAA
jgi:hypothetical protein